MLLALFLDPDADQLAALAAGEDEITAATERIFRHRVLSRAEEVALFERLEAGDQSARDTIAEHNLRLVAKIAMKYNGRGLEAPDLLSHGMLGLLRAIEGFEVARGLKFSTYATWWIRQAITRGIDEESRTIRLPVHLHERLRTVRKAIATLSTELGRMPELTEVAEACGLPVAKLRGILPHVQDATSLDRPVGDNGDSVLGDFVPDTAIDVATEALAGSLRSDLLLAFDRARLTDRERQVLVLRYGLDGGEQRTLEQVGQLFGCTRERIRQVERDALAKLRAPEISMPLEGYLDGPVLELAS